VTALSGIGFAAPVKYPAGTGAYSVAIGDFNADGKSDLAVANFDSKNVSILMGNGNGTFQSAVNYGTGKQPFSVTVGDFNSDGKTILPLPTTKRYRQHIAGQRRRYIPNRRQFHCGAGTLLGDRGEFNGDGRTDLAVANFRGDNVSILLGNGNGTFKTGVNYSRG
jgi:hypothetical protein